MACVPATKTLKIKYLWNKIGKWYSKFYDTFCKQKKYL